MNKTPSTRINPFFIFMGCMIILLSCTKQPDPPVNKIPVADAGSSLTIQLPTNSSTLTGTGTDADGRIVAYVWSQVSGPAAANLANSGSASTEVKNLIAGTYVFQLLVTDDKGATGTDTASLVVSPINKVPIADAGTSLTIQLPTNSATLTGTGTDSDGTIVSYLWNQVSGPAPTNIVASGSASTEVKNFIEGTYVFQLLVTDDEGAIDTDTAMVVCSSSTQTLTLQPDNNPNEYQVENLNGQNLTLISPEISIDQWTTSGLPWTLRDIFKFDLSSIPAGSTITSANLYLYSNPHPSTGNLIDANFGTSNSLLLQQVTANWSPSTLSWFNQPSASVATQIIIPSTTQSLLDLNLDVTGMVSSMVSNNANYGFLLKLQSEVLYNSRIFVSSSNTAYPEKHPKLVVVYQ